MLKSNSYSEWDDLSEAASIVQAIRQLHGRAELRAEAATNLSAILDCLGLTGAARQAVASSLAAAPAAGVVQWPPMRTIFWA